MTGMDETEEALRARPEADLAEIFLERRPDLKRKSIEAVRRVLRREARLSLRPLRNTKENPVAPAVKREAEEGSK